MIQNQDQIVRGACTQPDPIPKPDVDAFASEYGFRSGELLCRACRKAVKQGREEA